MRWIGATLFLVFSIIECVQFMNASDETSAFEGAQAGERRALDSTIFFRWCPSGEFVSVNPFSEQEENVKITAGYWIAETELTQGQWQKVMSTAPWKKDLRLGLKEGDNYPVVNVDFDDAIQFCEKMTAQERASGRLPRGWKYSLPSEVQWEYACRAGTKTAYFFGDNEAALVEFAWFRENTTERGEWCTHEVGLKQPNPWGLRDIYGNVSEWCSDERYIMSEPFERGYRNAKGPDHPIRGGWFCEDALSCDSSSIGYFRCDTKIYFLGFRLVAIPE